MRYKQLGGTGLFVSQACLGAMNFGNGASPIWSAMGALDQATADAVVARALAGGVNFIDTADVYADGASERTLGRSLANLGVKRSDVVIATKCTGQTGPGPNDRGASRGHIMDSIRRSLERLQLDYVDLFQIHAHDRITPLEETLRALDDLTREGLIRYVGVSNWPAWRVSKALGLCRLRNHARIDSMQVYYSVAGRDIEREITGMAQEEQVGLLVWSPLAGGFLTGIYARDGTAPAGARRTGYDFPPIDRARAFDCLDVLTEVAAAHGVSPARVALAWTLSKPFVNSIIIGATEVAHVDDNLAAFDLVLTADELARLDAVSALPAEYPGWMLEQQGRVRLPPPTELALN